MFIGIDIGTSGCRATAIDEDGLQLAEVNIEFPPQQSFGTHVSQDPQVWWDAVLDLFQTLSLQIDLPDVKAISVDGTSATLVLADKRGSPIALALMYNDARAVQELDKIRQHAPVDSAVHSASSTLAKVLWCQRHHMLDRCDHIMHQSDWIISQFSGVRGISDINNCIKLGYDAQLNIWPDWLKHFSLAEELLPRVVSPGTHIGQIRPEVAKQTGLPKDTQIFAGTTDSTAAVMATGIKNTGEAVTSLGSTLVLKVLADEPLFSIEHGIYSQPYLGQWLIGGASNTGGSVLLKFFSQIQLDLLTKDLQADKNTGLDYYPLLTRGERFPVNDPDLEPRLSPRPKSDVKFFQGILEGIAAIEHQGYRLLSELGGPFPARIYSTGGGAINEAWRMIREKEINVPVVSAKHRQAAYGTALLARNGWREHINTNIPVSESPELVTD